MASKSIAHVLGAIVGKVASWLISTAFILWGWNTLAPHLNAPLFSFWEAFAIRMAFTQITGILWQKGYGYTESSEE